MCLIVLSYKQHSTYPLILAANRDEEYERSTREARFWPEQPNILAGKDEKAGGTWLGINRSGSFSALTNYRDPTTIKENAPSRGHLVLDFLKQDIPPAEYLERIDKKSDAYSGFNLLAGKPDRIGYYSNQQKKITLLQPGLYGLSNHLLDTPWPKVKKAKQHLNAIIQNKKIPTDELFQLLADEQEASEEHLPDTGLSRDLEKKVSPIFIKSDKYGTRNSTILLIDKNGQVTFEERRFKPASLETDEINRYDFSLENI